MDLTAFLTAYLQDWVAWMSGPISVALTIWGFLRSGSDGKRAFIFAAAGVIFLLAPIHIWTIEHRARIEAEKKLALNEPDLRLGIIEALSGTDGDSIRLLITVRIKNLGTPSIADTWRVTLKNSDLRCQFEPLFIPSGGIKLGSEKHIAAEDAIYEKVATTPIAQGGQQVGVVVYAVRGCSKADLDKAFEDIQISVRDVTGKEVISGPFRGTRQRISTFYPGMKRP